MEQDRASLAESNAQILHLESRLAALALSADNLPLHEQRHLTQSSSGVTDISSHIHDLDPQISATRTARNLIQQRLDEYKYPVLSLPNETVAEIFLHFIPPYPDPPPTMGLESPVVLTLICRQWRETALTTPALWPAIELTYFEDHETARAKALAPYIAQLWLGRSGSLPLSVHYSYGNEASEDGDYPLLSTLVQYRSRWEHAGILLPNIPQINAIHGPMPLLRTLSFIVANGQTTTTDTDSNLETTPPFVFETPALSSLSIMGFHTLIVVFPWSQLTSLSLDRMRFPAYMPILRQATRLVQLTLRNMIPPLEILLPSSSSSPELDLDYTEAAMLLFFYLITPALVSLDLRESFLHGETEEERIDAMKVFIYRSGCALQQLRVVVEEGDAETAEPGGSLKAKAARYKEAFPTIPDIEVDVPEYL
ncbi:hypothetical protein R3P38DRAFT_2588419 [Favolaschia claudopus]|uniref:F-box domain-containing protein n=1 Tax=Favolaschia claudopus TaxID=2862362 RepID=A0AAV9Z2K8_9AGAR